MKQSDKTAISVIVTVRNEERTIEDCIKSLISQSLSKDLYEIIVVDGHSTDRTCEIVENLADNSPVKISLIQQERKGISSARNAGIRYAKGEIVMFIDGDAFACENWLEAYFKCFENEEDELGFAWGPVEASNDGNKIAKSLYMSYYSVIGAHGANIAYRKSAIKDIGYFDEEFKGRGDEVVVNLKLSKAGYKPKKCDAALVYHKLPTSVKIFLKLRYNEGYPVYMIAQKYYNNVERRLYYLKFILKSLLLIVMTSILISTMYWGVLSLIIFTFILIGMMIAYLKLLKITVKNSVGLTMFGLVIVLLGHICQVFGEMVHMTKEAVKR